MTGDWNCKECEHTEDECKDCYPELGYKNNKLKRDTEAVKRFVESDFFKKLMKSLNETDESFKMDEIYDMERKAREKGEKVLEDRNIEFIMPEATMDVDPIPDESIHTIDFAHGYDYCKNVMKKEIHNLFEDTMNGAAGEFIRGWNLALTKLLEVMESEDKE